MTDEYHQSLAGQAITNRLAAQKSLASHVIATLPENMSARKRVLEALLFILGDPELMQEVRDLLAHLNAHSIAQRELNLKLSDRTTSHKPPNDSNRPDGQS